jgi:hypothetical protein
MQRDARTVVQRNFLLGTPSSYGKRLTLTPARIKTTQPMDTKLVTSPESAPMPSLRSRDQ